jgi:hypothetical protein
LLEGFGETLLAFRFCHARGGYEMNDLAGVDWKSETAFQA